MKHLYLMAVLIVSITSMLEASQGGPYGYRRTDTTRPQYDYRHTGSVRNLDYNRMLNDYHRTGSARNLDYERQEAARLAKEKEVKEKEILALTKAVSNKFKMDEDETFTTETFKELAEKAIQDRRPFFIAAVEAPGNNYHIFHAGELATAFAAGQTKNPLNRQPIRRIFIYKYNGEEKADFPFDYVETIENYNTDNFKRIYGKLRAHL